MLKSKTATVLLISIFTLSCIAIPDWVPGRLLLLKRPYESWFEDNKNKITINFKKSGVSEYLGSGLTGAKTESGKVAFVGNIENRSADKLKCIIVDYKIKNKNNQTVLIQKRIAFELEVFPTIKRMVEGWFSASDYHTQKVLHEVYRAYTQAGDMVAWTYDLVTVIPDKLDLGDALEAYEVDAYVRLD